MSDMEWVWNSWCIIHKECDLCMSHIKMQGCAFRQGPSLKPDSLSVGYVGVRWTVIPTWFLRRRTCLINRWSRKVSRCSPELSFFKTTCLNCRPCQNAAGCISTWSVCMIPYHDTCRSQSDFALRSHMSYQVCRTQKMHGPNMRSVWLILRLPLAQPRGTYVSTST